MSNPSGSNSSRNGLIGAHGLPNLAQIPNISALHGLLANGLRHPFNNPHRQSISVEPPSRESNSSAEDSGQFSPSESKKMEEKTSPLAPNSWQNTPTKSHISQLEEQHRDINHNVQNVAKVLANLPPNVQAKLGHNWEESMKILIQKNNVQRMEAAKRKFNENLSK